MKKEYKNKILLYLLSFGLIAYLLINTGLFSDEFGLVHHLKNKSITDTLIIKDAAWITLPAEHFILLIWYRFFQVFNLLLVNILKISYLFLSFCLITKFFEIYLDTPRAFLVSFLFLFFPSHDSTAYWFLGYYLTLSFAFYLYAFYLAHRDKLFPAFLLALIASFMSYGSSVVAAALFMLFALDKAFKKGLILLVPNIIFAAYYILMTKVFHVSMLDRIPDKINVPAIVSQLALQFFSFLDAMLGPSMWLKIYYSFSQLSVISVIIGALLTIVFYKTYRESKKKYNLKLILSLMVLAFLSFAMFAVTGLYPQIAFNLGNRVTIFGSLLLAYLIVALPTSKKVSTAIFAILIFTILGISDHWKDWTLHQQKVIANIKNNQDLRDYEDARYIYVSGNQYSKYGKIGHIDFFSEAGVTAPVFWLLLERKDIVAVTINKRLKYLNGYMVDTKYDTKAHVDGYINVYDSEKDTLFRVNAGDIAEYIDSLPADNRHWTQAFNVKFIKDIAVRLMPRLKYAL